MTSVHAARLTGLNAASENKDYKEILATADNVSRIVYVFTALALLKKSKSFTSCLLMSLTPLLISGF